MKKQPLEIRTFASPLHDQSELFGSNREVLNLLKSKYDVRISDGQASEPPKPPYVLFIGTGGTERQVLNVLDSLPRQPVVLSDSYHNSLAASLEISSRLHNEGIAHQHINYPVAPTEAYVERFIQELDELTHIQKAAAAIAEARVGLVGGESDWLISSAIDREAVEKSYGTMFIDLPISQIVELFGKAEENAAPNELADKLSGDREPGELAKALKMYHVLNSLCKEHGLSAITVKCFDLLKPCDTTACLALSMLNDRGIVAGCEGDIPSLWSMLIAKRLCGTASFMANPSAIDRSSASVDFAHCTVPTSLAKAYTLPSHYESKMGIAVAASMNLENYTMFKCGGKNLDKFYAFEGELVQNTTVVERCRTQVRFRFNDETNVDKFLQSYLGNHTILIPGHHARMIERFFR